MWVRLVRMKTNFLELVDGEPLITKRQNKKCPGWEHEGLWGMELLNKYWSAPTFSVFWSYFPNWKLVKMIHFGTVYFSTILRNKFLWVLGLCTVKIPFDETALTARC